MNKLLKESSFYYKIFLSKQINNSAIKFSKYISALRELN